jgi:hypothetical protein
MTEKHNSDHVVRIMQNCSGQLRKAHADLHRNSAPIDPLTKISGVADALDTLVGQIVALVDEAEHARRTAGGLQAERRRRSVIS